ncbi:MAG: hypothetical protein AAFU41_18280 [Pseudomonadota bacterium]
MDWIFTGLAAIFALFIGRSAIIVFWPDSGLAEFCEGRLGWMDSIGDGLGDGGSDGDGGGDGGGD